MRTHASPGPILGLTTPVGNRVWRASHGYTVIELMIVTIIMSLFFFGLFALYRGGQSASTQAVWIQKTTNDMRDAGKRLQKIIQASSYPSTLAFPGGIFTNRDPVFALHYSSRALLNVATEAKAVSAPWPSPGTQVLRFTEASSERVGYGGTASPPHFIHHVISVTQSGHMLHHTYEQTLALQAPPNYVAALTPAWTVIPPGGLTSAKVILSDVATVRVTGIPDGTTPNPVTITVTCRWPRGQTTRQESITVVPNVGCIAQATSGSDW